MVAVAYPVMGREKVHESFYSGPDDLLRGPAQPTDPSRVLVEPGWSPYCIDTERRELVFAHVPPRADLPGAAFYALAQYRGADMVLTMSLDEAHDLADALPDPRVIYLFSIGRCGSTLVSHALNAPANVVSLSEPGAFDHRPIQALAAGRRSPDSLIRDLNRLLMAAHRAPGKDTLIVKFRSQVLFVAEAFWRAVPEATYLFMYREATAWAASFVQFTIDIGVPIPLDEDNRRIHWMMISGDRPIDVLARYVDLDERPISTPRAFAPAWSVHLLEYLRLLRMGVPFLALRYEDLVANRTAELERLFTHCGLVLDGIPGALAAFDEDSQKGTAIARKANKWKFTPEDLAVFLETLAKEPEIADPNLILPDIARPDRPSPAPVPLNGAARR